MMSKTAAHVPVFLGAVKELLVAPVLQQVVPIGVERSVRGEWAKRARRS